jgi:hypothetical protein
MAERGVQTGVKRYDRANSGKIKGFAPAEPWLASYVDQEGVEQQAIVYRVGDHFYMTLDAEEQGRSLRPPTAWMGKALNSAYVKVTQALRKLSGVTAREPARGQVDAPAVPADDAVEVD